MTFFFYFLGYDSHDAPDVAATKRRVRDEEALLRYLLDQQAKKPKLAKKLNKDSLRATLQRHFRGKEVEQLLKVVAEPEVISARDLINAYRAKLTKVNRKKIDLLMAVLVLDEDEYEH